MVTGRVVSINQYLYLIINLHGNIIFFLIISKYMKIGNVSRSLDFYLSAKVYLQMFK